MRGLFFLVFVINTGLIFTQNEPYLSNQTYTYWEAISEYQKLAEKYPKYSNFQSISKSDFGEPVSLFMINKSGKFDPRALDEKIVFLVNNAIHPGEPEGVDACIKWSKELLSNPTSIPENVIIAIIPIYNIGGANNRNCCTRANQNGPLEYGFRGNSRNLDLNRDFTKSDSKNTHAFFTLFHLIKPSVFIDTHTSNGADYQYVMTLITSQLNKMNPILSDYVSSTMQPWLYEQMEKKGYPMVPYVNTLKQTPDDGIVDYLETPRYSTGYTNLFNTISFVAETHMLKPFEQRVEATYELLKTTLEFMENNHQSLKKIKQQANEQLAKTEYFCLNWKLDTAVYKMIPFKGYQAVYKPSEVTGKDRLYYDTEQPYTKNIKYYNHYIGIDTIKRPEYYIIPQAWDDVVQKLKKSNVPIYEFSKDIKLDVEMYFIRDFETVKSPYEGHYLHYNVKVEKAYVSMSYRAGDYVIPTRNNSVRFILETLEPHAVDSYLAWNYFDAVLQQKEWFSAYVFEDEAPKILAENPELKKAFEEQKKNDADFASNTFAQLYFIYKGSGHYEITHNRYPVARYMKIIPSELLQENINLR